MSNIIIKEINAHAPEYQQVWQLREDVLRKPLDLSLKDEDLSADFEDLILIAVENNTVVGCVMLHPLRDGIIKLRQMAVAEHLQQKGICRLLVQAAEVTSKKQGYKKIELHARELAIGFYEKLGYAITSTLFMEVNIPHKKMEKGL